MSALLDLYTQLMTLGKSNPVMGGIFTIWVGGYGVPVLTIQ